jgi:acetoin utilization deacetylase AcuC-like enzyme
MHTISVHYTPRQAANVRSRSPSAGKPPKVVADWVAHGLPIHLVEPTPVSVDDLCLAHDRAYVEDVLACRRPNGFGTRDAEVAASLPFTTGSLLSAARDAIGNGRVACSPTSGFHHARYASGGGFCTFNGLVVTARMLLREGARHVGILDCDEHYGDGTDEILGRDRSRGIRHTTVGETWHHPAQAADFLRELPGMVRAMRGCDVLLYQAGADPHIDDPLGGWLTDAQLRERDQIVFATARAMGLPVAWNLAGGYQQDEDGGIAPVLAIHRATMEACVDAHVREGAGAPAV